jgi:hypothetical protein
MRGSLIALLAATLGYGQTMVRANIPFEFTVQGKVLPAGQYQLAREPGKDMIRISGTAKGAAIIAPVITRLSREVHTIENAHLVFDKVGETSFLSELWVPGQDGFLLHSTKGQHEHKVLDVPR